MKYREMIAHTLYEFMSDDDKGIILGIGVTDPKGIFETTSKINHIFPERTVEIPLSENAVTGACVGLALEGFHPILIHARADFLTISAEHIVNTAAKWNASHGSLKMEGLVIRAIVGRGWGQGTQHSQNLGSMFQGIPGVSVIMPIFESTYYNALRNWDGSVTILIEPRRLYDCELPIVEGVVGNFDACIYTYGDIVLDAIKAKTILLEEYHINTSIIPVEYSDPDNLRIYRDSNFVPSVICETSSEGSGLGYPLLSLLREAGGIVGYVSPPATPCPTSVVLESQWYPSERDIVRAVLQVLGMPYLGSGRHSVIEKNPVFVGPF